MLALAHAIGGAAAPARSLKLALAHTIGGAAAPARPLMLARTTRPVARRRQRVG